MRYYANVVNHNITPILLPGTVDREFGFRSSQPNEALIG